MIFDRYRRFLKMSNICWNFWHFPVDFGLSVRFLVCFAKVLGVWNYGKFLKLFWLSKYRESWKAENFRQTHCLNIYSIKVPLNSGLLTTAEIFFGPKGSCCTWVSHMLELKYVLINLNLTKCFWCFSSRPPTYSAII